MHLAAYSAELRNMNMFLLEDTFKFELKSLTQSTVIISKF